METKLIEPVNQPLILVVDDDLIHHRVLEQLARRLGMRFHMVSSCGETLESLSLHSFDLILMDYRMPEMDGCTCARRIREIPGKYIPIIAVTAHIMGSSREECIAAGMDDFLAKPFTVEEMRAKVNQWLNRGESR